LKIDSKLLDEDNDRLKKLMSELEIANTEMKRNLEDVKKEKNKLNKERDAL